MAAFPSVVEQVVQDHNKVSPIKRLSISRLELCGSEVLSRLLQHVKEVLQVSMSDIFAWTDSTIVLSWLVGNPKRFKIYVGNQVSSIVDKIPPDRWNHVSGTDNPADCASHGLLPSELQNHNLWWTGTPWLSLDSSLWPKQPSISAEQVPKEEKEICLVTITQPDQPIIPFDHYSTFSRLQHVTAWTLRFVNNC